MLSETHVHVPKYPFSTTDYVVSERVEKTRCANSFKISFNSCYPYRIPQKQLNVRTAVPIGHDATICSLIFKSIRVMLPATVSEIFPLELRGQVIGTEEPGGVVTPARRIEQRQDLPASLIDAAELPDTVVAAVDVGLVC